MYGRFDQAVRDTGYDGLVMASNWQAGSASSHYYNLHSDAQFDVVDRHAYFGGKKNGGTMLRIPGGGSYLPDYSTLPTARLVCLNGFTSSPTNGVLKARLS